MKNELTSDFIFNSQKVKAPMYRILKCKISIDYLAGNDERATLTGRSSS